MWCVRVVIVAQVAVKNSGCDFVFLDTEHIPIDREKLSWMCRTYAAMGIPPIVRVPGAQLWCVGEVRDFPLMIHSCQSPSPTVRARIWMVVQQALCFLTWRARAR